MSRSRAAASSSSSTCTATAPSPSVRSTLQRRPTHAEEQPPLELDRDEVSKSLRPARGLRHFIGKLGWKLAACGVAAFVAKLLFSAWLWRFTSTRCWLIDWKAPLRIFTVPTVRTQQELDASIRRREPCLLLDALRGWPAVGKWSPQWFGEELGDQVVEAYFWGRTGSDWRRTRVFEVTLAQYARLVKRRAERVAAGKEAGPAPYLQEDEYLFAENEGQLLADVDGLPFRPYLLTGGRVSTETAFWMGPAGAKTGIHWDAVNALLHQVRGNKRVTLWPPSAKRDLYPSPKYNHGAGLSLVDAAAPNHTLYPRFAKARSITTTLTAGSALFVPAGWWHAVESLDDSISLAYRSQTACQARASLPDDALRWLHDRGWYKRGNCVCHPELAGAAAAADDDGVGEAVATALREAGAEEAADRSYEVSAGPSSRGARRRTTSDAVRSSHVRGGGGRREYD